MYKLKGKNGFFKGALDYLDFVFKSMYFDKSAACCRVLPRTFLRETTCIFNRSSSCCRVLPRPFSPWIAFS